jgi:predicted NACHT family NTPase
MRRPLTPQEQVQHERELKSYRDRLIAANEYLDFRGIMQMREILRLRLEEIYVPLWATTSEPQSLLPTERIKAEAERVLQTRQPAMFAEDARLQDLVHVEHASERRVEIAQTLREQQRIVVLGDPGTGKSALLKLLALTFARGREAVRDNFGLDEDRLPLLVPIAAYGEAVTKAANLSFADFLAQRLAADGLKEPATVQHALGRGECILLLDGLDEVLDLNTRIHVSRQIERFINDSDLGNRVIVTSRIAGYQRVGFTGDFVHLTLLSFGEEEIRTFAHNWSAAYERVVNPHGWIVPSTGRRN